MSRSWSTVILVALLLIGGPACPGDAPSTTEDGGRSLDTDLDAAVVDLDLDATASRPGDDDHHVYVDPTPYATGCDEHADCVLAADPWECGCGGACTLTAVLESERDAYVAALEMDQMTCSPEAACDVGGPDCNAEYTARAGCVDGACVVAMDAECFEASECTDVREWADPDAVECVDFTCRECDGDDYYDPGGCPEGYFCRVEYCLPLDACSSPDDCGPVQGDDDADLGCRDGFCRPCRQNEECGADHVCATRASQMRPGCWADSQVRDVACLNGTCPRPCRWTGTTWICR